MHKLDIMVGSESWPTSSHMDSELFPKILGYTPYRQDRETNICGGGVFFFFLF